MIVIGVLIAARRYLASVSAFLMFVFFVVILCLGAPYQIASDQFRLRFRTVEGTSYLEFPERLHFLKSIARSFGTHRLITIANCDDTKVAELPLLPYEPMFLENNIVDTVGFRRLPDLQLENIELNVEVFVDHSTPSDGTPHGSLGFEFGFSSTDQATIPLTLPFPRSMKRKKNNVPLIPILEVLPWTPDDVGSLVKASIKVDQFRKSYPEHPISLDQLRQIRMTDDGTYGALLDFAVYSLMYQMFDGNVFAQMRAHLGNTLCAVVDSHPSAFSGPFGALPDNFIRRLVAELKSKITQVAPACRVSEELVRAYESSGSPDEPMLPFDVTFKKCLNTTTSMAQCLKRDDEPKSKATCNSLACSVPAPPALPDEMLLEDYDDKFHPGGVKAQ